LRGAAGGERGGVRGWGLRQEYRRMLVAGVLEEGGEGGVVVARESVQRCEEGGVHELQM